MSRHSELIQARQEVLEAVEAWDKAVPNYWNNVCTRLSEAWEKYDAIRKNLSGPGAASARRTSIAAAHSTLPMKNTVRRSVIQAIASHFAMFKDGMTTNEVESRLRKSHQTVSSAVNFAENAGWIRDTGRTRKTQYGKDAIVYEPTQIALDALQEAWAGQ